MILHALSPIDFGFMGLLKKRVGVLYLEPNRNTMQKPKRGRSVMAFSAANSMLKTRDPIPTIKRQSRCSSKAACSHMVAEGL